MKLFVEYTEQGDENRRVVIRPAITEECNRYGMIAGRKDAFWVSRPRGGWPKPTAQGKCERMAGMRLLPLGTHGFQRSIGRFYSLNCLECGKTRGEHEY